jgi:hypothetical protein
MKIVKKSLFLVLILLVLSCEKENISRNKFAGVWKIKKMTQSYYTCSNNSQNQDSSFTTDEVGVIMLVDRAGYGNILDIDTKSFKGRKPIFFIFLNPNDPSWESDYSATRLRLSNVVYTVEKLSFGGYRLSYIEKNNCPDYFSYKEQFIMKRVNP